MTPPVQPLDLSRLRVHPLAQRESLTRAEEILLAPEAPSPPCPDRILPLIGDCATHIRTARARGATVLLLYGAHLLRNGAAAILDRLMARGC